MESVVKGIKEYFLSFKTTGIFNRNKTEIIQVNNLALGMSAVIALIMFLIMDGIILFSNAGLFYNDDKDYIMFILYTILAVLDLIFIFIVSFVTKKIPSLVLPLFYFQYVVIFLYAIFNSFIIEPLGLVFSCQLVILIFPMIILDKSYRVNSFVTILFICFIICSHYFKGKCLMSLWQQNYVNTIASYIIGLAAGQTIRHSRLQAIENKRQIVIQRDTDTLTQLPNRRKLFEDLTTSQEGRAESVKCLFMIDIDFFKKYNDTYGHQTGDEVLFKIGKTFKKFGDKTGFELYRYGGEEFVGCYRKAAPAEFEVLLHSLCKAVHELRIEQGIPDKPYLTISIGFCDVSKTKAENFDQMISQADTALYEAKNRGRNCVVEYK